MSTAAIRALTLGLRRGMVRGVQRTSRVAADPDLWDLVFREGT